METENLTINNNQERLVDSSKYHLTLLVCYFLGSYGIHRMVNKKVKSGIAMLSLCLAMFLFLIIQYVLLIVATVEGGEVIEESIPSLIGVLVFGLLTFVISAILQIWIYVDVITIMRGKFTIGKTNQVLTSGKPFLSTWSNVLVLVLFTFSVLLWLAIGIFVLAAIFSGM